MHAELINLHDFEARAKEVLPDAVWNRVEGGAEDEITLRRNREACQWRSKKGPPWRCKKGPLGGCGLVP